tara:strand:- start:111 stop:713 length:603 start_codon:yes stop_codon:yes gene_type:complete
MKINKKNSLSFKVLSSLSEDKIRQIYNIHLKSLPNDIIHYFGYKLEKKYILELLKENKCRIIVAISNKSIVGFIILKFGVFDMKKVIDFSSVLRFLINSISNPILILRLIYQLCKPTTIPKQSCEIDYFAVSYRFKSKGIGKKLLRIAEKIAKGKKFKKIFTKTYNKKLACFYINKKKAVLSSRYKILHYLYFCVYWKIN